jgi:hypothetical protein
MNPEQWDLQVQFWSDLIMSWGPQAEIVDCSITKLSQPLMYRDFDPLIQPVLDSLVKTGWIKIKEDCLVDKSFVREFLLDSYFTTNKFRLIFMYFS